MTTLRIDRTKSAQFVACPRKYYFRHERNLVPSMGSSALRYGITVHKGLDIFYSTIHKKGWDNLNEAISLAVLGMTMEYNSISEERQFWEDYRNIENAIDLFMKFTEFFEADKGQIEILECEKYFEFVVDGNLMLNYQIPYEIVRVIDHFVFCGIIDAIASMGGTKWIMEYKTTAQPLSMQSKRLHRNPQTIGYNFYEKSINLNDVSGSIITILHTSARKRKDGTYPPPKFDFHRSIESYLKKDLADWLTYQCYIALNMQDCKTQNHWPPIFDNCYQFGKCEYTSLCEQGVPLDEIQTFNFVEIPHWDPKERVES